MARNHDDKNAVRQYLLRELSEDKQRTIELRFLTEDDLFEELEIAEDELIDEYLAEELSDDERKAFEKYFLTATQRKQKLRFAEAVKRQMSAPTPQSVTRPVWFFQLMRWLRQSFFASPMLVATSILIVGGLGFAVWRGFFYQSDVDRGLLALNAAYSQQRPTEARITQLQYAPFVTTRGPGTSSINELELSRAELTLLAAIHNKPTPAVHHALGKVYLAKKDFDRAIEHFQEALKDDPNNAQIYADVGAAYLEKGKLEIEKGQSDKAGSDAGKGLEDLGRSLENLNKALELNPNLLEAIFNRALCHQRLMLFEQAEDDWRQYLKKDPTSQWADEARRNLSRLEEQKNKASETKEELLREFLKAYEARRDDNAWDAITQSRARTGNLIIEALLNDYLDLRLSGRLNEAEQKLQRISYAGKIEREKAGDHFTSDVAKFYSAATGQELGFLVSARAQMKLATEHFNKGEFDQAIDLYSQAKMAFARRGDTPEALLPTVGLDTPAFAFLNLRKAQNSSRSSLVSLNRAGIARSWPSRFMRWLTPTRASTIFKGSRLRQSRAEGGGRD